MATSKNKITTKKKSARSKPTLITAKKNFFKKKTVVANEAPVFTGQEWSSRGSFVSFNPEDAPRPASNLESLPICIVLKNVTDSVINNVSLFNFDHEKQRDIIYSGDSIDYNKILRFIQSYTSVDNKIAGRVHIESTTNAKQAFVTLFFDQFHVNGSTSKYPFSPKLNPLQQQTNVANCKLNFLLCVGADIFISKIYPNTTVTYSLYLNKQDSEIQVVKKQLAELQEKFELLSARLPTPKINSKK